VRAIGVIGSHCAPATDGGGAAEGGGHRGAPAAHICSVSARVRSGDAHAGEDGADFGGPGAELPGGRGRVEAIAARLVFDPLSCITESTPTLKLEFAQILFKLTLYLYEHTLYFLIESSCACKLFDIFCGIRAGGVRNCD
jgi:hypothetical protein